MGKPRNKWEARTPADDGELSFEEQSLDEPEMGMEDEAELSGDSGLDADEAWPEGDEQGSSREAPSKTPGAPLTARFEGMQVRMREVKAGRGVIGVDIELASNKARPRGEETSPGAEDEMSEPEEQEPGEGFEAEATAEEGEQGDGFAEEEDVLEAEAGEHGDGFAEEEEELEAEAGDFAEEELEAEAGEQGEGFAEEEELEAEAGEHGDGFAEEGLEAEAGEQGEGFEAEEEEGLEAGEQGSPRGDLSKRPGVPLTARFEGLQVRMRKGKAGRGVLGIDIGLAFDKAKPRGEEAFPGAEDEVSEPEEQEAVEGFEAEEELEAEAGEQGEGFEAEEELEAEAGEQGEGVEEPEAKGFKSLSMKTVSSQRVAAGAPRKLRLSPRGEKLIAQLEGIKPRLYDDAGGNCTIGIGHLVHRGKCNGSESPAFKKGLTREQAFALMRRDLQRMEKAVHGLDIPLNQNQFDALVSFTYNRGQNWMKEKTGLRDALLAHRYSDVPREMLARKWITSASGGRPLQGLITRRKTEGRLFATGGKPVPPKKPGSQVVKVADVQPDKKNPSVLIVQKALAKAVGLDYSSAPGKFGPRTKKAYAAWQRKCGFSGSAADGKPGPKSLKLLGDKYGFTVLGAPKPPTTPPSGRRVPSPVPGHKVTTRYGKPGKEWQAGYHTGDDYKAPEGTPVVAVRDGKIVWSKPNNRFYGNWIGVKADNGRTYVYAHLSSRAVKAGQKVKAGQVIGKVGHTGNTTGPHLHFEDHSREAYEYRDHRKPAW